MLVSHHRLNMLPISLYNISKMWTPSNHMYKSQNTQSTRYITLDYLPINHNRPDVNHAQKIFHSIQSLPGNENFLDVECFLEKLQSDYDDILNFGKEHCKKQCVEFAQKLNVRYNNNNCNSWNDLRNLWASKEGLDQHNIIWQVMSDGLFRNDFSLLHPSYCLIIVFLIYQAI